MIEEQRTENLRTDNEHGLLTEHARRYYLDVMGIQCWESVDEPASESDQVIVGNRVCFTSLETEIQQCKKCQLHETRKLAVAGQGDQSADLMFVFMSPDISSSETGLLCGNEALSLFDKMLAAIGLSIDDVFMTSLLKCSVPGQHTISMTEVSHCSSYLKQQIKLVQPRLIVVLGDTASRCLLQKDAPLDDLRNEVNIKRSADAYLFESVPLLVSYSPHELLQDPKNKRKSWSDLQQMQKLIEN